MYNERHLSGKGEVHGSDDSLWRSIPYRKLKIIAQLWVLVARTLESVVVFLAHVGNKEQSQNLFKCWYQHSFTESPRGITSIAPEYCYIKHQPLSVLHKATVEFLGGGLKKNGLDNLGSHDVKWQRCELNLLKSHQKRDGTVRNASHETVCKNEEHATRKEGPTPQQRQDKAKGELKQGRR